MDRVVPDQFVDAGLHGAVEDAGIARKFPLVLTTSLRHGDRLAEPQRARPVPAPRTPRRGPRRHDGRGRRLRRAGAIWTVAGNDPGGGPREQPAVRSRARRHATPAATATASSGAGPVRRGRSARTGSRAGTSFRWPAPATAARASSTRAPSPPTSSAAATRRVVWKSCRRCVRSPARERWNFPAPPYVAHTKHIDIDPRDDDTLYVSIEQGALLKSIDGGRSFHELHFQDETYVLNKDTHRIVFNPHNPDELFLPGGDGISHSRDGGATWERIATPAMRVGYPDATFCSPDGRRHALHHRRRDVAEQVAQDRQRGRGGRAQPRRRPHVGCAEPPRSCAGTSRRRRW